MAAAAGRHAVQVRFGVFAPRYAVRRPSALLIGVSIVSLVIRQRGSPDLNPRLHQANAQLPGLWILLL
jgi:hypothetical protein